MYQILDNRLARLGASPEARCLTDTLVGLEKESLRASVLGGIAQTPHPAALGSALTHPYITTDYAEALLEFITPPFADRCDALEFLRDAHLFVYRHIGAETLWATSMPCVLAGDESIRIGYYGESNAGRMKHIYRRGLGHRYGQTMQVIAGVHFNYSLPDSFWALYQRLEGWSGALRGFKDAGYFAMIRNLQPDDEELEDWALVLFDQAALSEGAPLEQPAAYVRRINALLTQAAGWTASPSDAE